VRNAGIAFEKYKRSRSVWQRGKIKAKVVVKVANGTKPAIDDFFYIGRTYKLFIPSTYKINIRLSNIFLIL
jgi:hypothetical protein